VRIGGIAADNARPSAASSRSTRCATTRTVPG
jgi:hypothetical protein